MQKTLQEVLSRIKPTEKEEKEVMGKINSLLDKINKGLKDAKAILGGSGIKGTWLKEANDADIFVKFNYIRYRDKSQELANILEKILKKKGLKISRLHGSRDYFQIKHGTFTFEIIPILDIKKAEQAKNITDVSPLHAEWVNKKTKNGIFEHTKSSLRSDFAYNKKGKNLKDEIRLLKQFCKSAGVYGAESYINGFSGYICEILAIHYKGFISLVKNATKWKDKVMIDVENHWKGKNMLMELNKSKTLSPIIVIDPVQADRNASAALSIEKFNKFREACRSFLKKPSEKFFEITEIDEGALKKKAAKNELIIIDVIPEDGKKDVIGCKLRKSFEYIKANLEKNEFKVIGCGWGWSKKALFYFIIKKEKLPEFIEREGPPLSNKIHAERFKKAHQKEDVYAKNKKIYAKVKRRHMQPVSLVNELIKDPYLEEKAKGMKTR